MGCYMRTSEVIKGRQEVASDCVPELAGRQVERQAAKERVSLLPCALPIALLMQLLLKSSGCILTCRSSQAGLDTDGAGIVQLPSKDVDAGPRLDHSLSLHVVTEVVQD